jgi:hypothetical protein
MILKTYGHASLSFQNEKSDKIYLITDPWLIGSCYWRSWWLQNYPNQNELNILAKSESVFLTHEHWDHAHFPTLKKFFSNKKIYIPELNSKRLKNTLENNFKAEEINPFKWKNINNISYLSIPLYNDDSILLFKYGKYLICNINDSKPTPQIIKRIKEVKRDNRLKLILLQSYAPASIVNSFRNSSSSTISIKGKMDYLNYVQKNCRELNAEYFIPFASQAVYSRPDSKWANDHKLDDKYLFDNWKITSTKLLKSYTSFDLDSDYHFRYIRENNVSSNMHSIAEKEYEKNKYINLNVEKLNTFSKITSPVSLLLFALYPFGLHFKFNNNFYLFNFLKNKFKIIDYIPKHYFEMPAKEFYESCLNEHFTDTGTSFILKITINRKYNIYQSYLLFIFLTFSEKGYFSNLKMFFQQLIVLKNNFFPKKIS